MHLRGGGMCGCVRPLPSWAWTWRNVCSLLFTPDGVYVCVIVCLHHPLAGWICCVHPLGECVCALTHTKAMCVPAHGLICADVCACLYRMCAKDRLCAWVCLVGCTREGGWSGRAKPFPLLGSLQSQWHQPGSICKAWFSLGPFSAWLPQALRETLGCQVCPFPESWHCATVVWF